MLVTLSNKILSYFIQLTTITTLSRAVCKSAIHLATNQQGPPSSDLIPDGSVSLAYDVAPHTGHAVHYRDVTRVEKIQSTRRQSVCIAHDQGSVFTTGTVECRQAC